VAQKLSQLGIDLLEVSGGSYERPVMMTQKESTKKREAYFLKYAAQIKTAVQCPVLVTGGFRSAAAMNQALSNSETDMIGLARPIALDPDFAHKLLSGDEPTSLVKPLTSGFSFIDKVFPLEILWYTQQLERMGQRKSPNPKAGVWLPIVKSIKDLF